MSLDTVFFLELVNAAAGIDKLLLACKERVARGANLNTEVILNGARLEAVPARASNRYLVILRMNSFFHNFHLFPPWLCMSNQS